MKKGSKRVMIDPKVQRVVTHEEVADQLLSAAKKGHDKGYDNGYKNGQKDAATNAFADMVNVWDEVSKHATTAANYAATISRMYKARTPQETKE